MNSRCILPRAASSDEVRRRLTTAQSGFARGFLRWLLAIVAVLAGLQAHAEGVHSPESVKAAYLFHFSGYVEWPEAPAGQITIGVLGDRVVAAELKRIVPGRSIENRNLRVRDLKSNDDLSGVHVLYVGPSEVASLPALVQKARRHHLLLVADTHDGLDQGATVNFVTAERRIRFEISQKAAEEAGLKLSSRLLSAALRLKRSFRVHPEILAVHSTIPSWTPFP